MSSQLSNPAIAAGWNFESSYLSLPESFYTRTLPVPVRQPKLAVFNDALAETLGLNPGVLNSEAGAAIFAGNIVPDGATPLAQAYAGHQFGNFTMLGDGRAVLLGEHVTRNGQRVDIQLKGSGPTAYSRRGDGRAALGPMLREYIISEAMHALGIPTTRSLAVVTTGEPVMRDTPLLGAILTRVAASHIRVGTFQYAAGSGGPEATQALADYTLQRHYPELVNADNQYEAFLLAVIERQAALIAKWQGVGFIHGVMNTDNMTLSGETIDYGPCAFMDAYDPATVFSSIDRQGRYAYGNQPAIAQWNLARLTETLLPLFSEDDDTALGKGQAAITTFPGHFERFWLTTMRAKLGLLTEEEDDKNLVESLLTWMQQSQSDFTNTFRALSSDAITDAPYFNDTDFAAWYASWQARLSRQPQTRDAVFAQMQAHNPAVIPRNYQVEAALSAAVDSDDFSVMHDLLNALKTPYSHIPGHADYCLPPESGGPAYRTFCGT